MNWTGVMVPVELVIPVVLGLVGALGWLARRYDRANERLINQRAGEREAKILLREAIRERDPGLDPLSFDDETGRFAVEYEKDKARMRSLSIRPLPPKEDDRAVVISPDQRRRIERYNRGEDPSTPPDPVEPLRRKT